MIEKYYTPTIEEFHVGFEFELAYSFTKNGVRQEDLLVGHTIEVNSDLELIQEQIKENLIRVKCLDREDIESLGFKFSEELSILKTIWPTEKLTGTYTSKTYIFNTAVIVDHIEYDGLILIKYPKTDYTIIKMFHTPYQYIVFKGEIKNKSELTKLLKQLGIK